MKEHLVKIKLSDVKSNPNRDLAFNPYNEEKIAALMASIGETGFWTNVIVRQSPDGKGYEQAYGHHRIESARRCGIKEADFVVRDLDENMMLKMMELENQEDYRYCPLSLLETCKAVVNALATGRIAPFHPVETGEIDPKELFKGASKIGDKWKAKIGDDYLGIFSTKEEAAKAYREAIKGRVLLQGLENARCAPSFVPKSVGVAGEVRESTYYTAVNIAEYLGKTTSNGVGRPRKADPKVFAALDALYLLEVKSIKTSDIKDMNWSQLGKFVAEIKQRRERANLVATKTRKQLEEIRIANLQLQAEQKEKECKVEEERKALVKKLAEAETERKAKKLQKELQVALKKKAETQEKIMEDFKEKRRVLEKKVEQINKEDAEMKQADVYLPLRKETDRIVHLLERHDEEEEIKALARKALNPNDRKRLSDAALAKGARCEDMAKLIWNSAPKSAKESLKESAKREATKRRAETKGETK
jgi:hypothetical protein